MNITEKFYEENIPKCCKLKTAKEHKEQLMLCWGLVYDLENGIFEKECGRECECHINHDPELLKEILKKVQEEP